MDRVSDLADLVRPRDGLRVIGGRVVQVVDATHVLVDLGDKAVTASGAAPVGADVRLLVGGGVVELIQAPPTPTPVPYRMASGSTSLTFSGTNASVGVTFPAGRFSVTPRFMVALRESRQIIISATDETTSGGTIRGTTINGETYSGSVPVAWVAWQMTPTSKD